MGEFSGFNLKLKGIIIFLKFLLPNFKSHNNFYLSDSTRYHKKNIHKVSNFPSFFSDYIMVRQISVQNH